MKKALKKLKFELDSRQMVLLFAGMAVLGILVFYAGVMVGSKSAKQEIASLKSSIDLRKRIKAPSLIKAQKPEPKEEKAQSIEEVLDSAGSSQEKPALQKEVPEKKAASPDVASSARDAEKKVDQVQAKISPKSPEKSYYVQVAAFRKSEDADRRLGELAKKGYKAIIVKAEVKGKGIYHRIRLGPFGTLDKAKAFALSFEKKEKVPTFIPMD